MMSEVALWLNTFVSVRMHTCVIHTHTHTTEGAGGENLKAQSQLLKAAIYVDK